MKHGDKKCEEPMDEEEDEPRPSKKNPSKNKARRMLMIKQMMGGKKNGSK